MEFSYRQDATYKVEQDESSEPPHLPVEILSLIVSHVDLEEFLTLTRVNTTFRRLVYSHMPPDTWLPYPLAIHILNNQSPSSRCNTAPENSLHTPPRTPSPDIAPSCTPPSIVTIYAPIYRLQYHLVYRRIRLQWGNVLHWTENWEFKSSGNDEIDQLRRWREFTRRRKESYEEEERRRDKAARDGVEYNASMVGRRMI